MLSSVSLTFKNHFLGHAWKGVGRSRSSGKVHRPHVLGQGGWPRLLLTPGKTPPLPARTGLFLHCMSIYTSLHPAFFSLTALPATQPNHCSATDTRTNLITHFIPVYRSAFSRNLIPIWPFFHFAQPLIRFPTR